MLADAQRRGLLGSLDLDLAIDQSLAYLTAAPPRPTRLIDLGSGAGVPGLVIAALGPAAAAPMATTLVERSRSRADWLVRAIGRLGLTEVDVLASDAVEAGRGRARATADLVTARGFAPLPILVECAAPLLAEGGTLVVSLAPDAEGVRDWPAVGLRFAERIDTGGIVLGRYVAVAPCPPRYPRRSATMRRRPLS